jgi:hypothetical protein
MPRTSISTSIPPQVLLCTECARTPAPAYRRPPPPDPALLAKQVGGLLTAVNVPLGTHACGSAPGLGRAASAAQTWLLWGGAVASVRQHPAGAVEAGWLAAACTLVTLNARRRGGGAGCPSPPSCLLAFRR